MTWTKGAHTIKFGVEGRKLIAPQTFTQRVRGDYEYNNLLTYLQDGAARIRSRNAATATRCTTATSRRSTAT